MTTIHRPQDENEAAGIIRAAWETRAPLAIEGGGTRAGIGRPLQAAATLSSTGLNGIIEYNPAEMVITVAAGTPVATVETALAEAGQRFAFEPADYRALLGSTGEPTVGALAAANISGPRRFVAGAARDSLLGVRFVNGQGEIVRNGGKVMKNVTGLDLVKLMAGSWGTLGFLTQVTFKVQPVPESRMTLAIRGLLEEDAVNALAHAMATSADVSGAAHLPELVADKVLDGRLGSAPATLLRLEGFETSIRIRAERLKALLGSLGEIEEIGAERSAALWTQVRDLAPFAGGQEDKPVWRISMKPSEAHKAVMALRMQVGATAFYDWQGGLVWLRLETGDPEDQAVRAAVARFGGGHATLVRASGPVRASIPVFQPQSRAVAALSRRVKETFDPAGILNPGRMAAEA
ncbi:glycolate oxidase subunit GlcE [Zhengella mangrovi]|uniref:Glycolate oxidase subunit GlcE n=1 Tax=Zhengella mangrovi TaxID=1982044 RepID=A0A2G1QL23_9HYPH|nr:glycolate oxidase subunit GlcE [Zhengella mangrovi]PHP66235.1 glycolate oxidase subunit GlcE [Zhengella mangrovi]